MFTRPLLGSMHWIEEFLLSSCTQVRLSIDGLRGDSATFYLHELQVIRSATGKALGHSSRMPEHAQLKAKGLRHV